jgi:heterotetrameric sarcosine oxidase gamma subunit
VSLAFLAAAESESAPAARSPFEAALAASGATFAVRDGWRVPTGFGAPHLEAAGAQPVAWTDASHLGKLELGDASGAELAGIAGGLQLGSAVRHRGAWWCMVTPCRALVIGNPATIRNLRAELAAQRLALRVLDVTSQFAALRLGGPQARETIARFCALDLRDQKAPVGAFRPGSVARTPGYVVRESTQCFLILAGAAFADHLWRVVSDAGRRLGGRPVGIDAFPAPSDIEEDTVRA